MARIRTRKFKNFKQRLLGVGFSSSWSAASSRAYCSRAVMLQGDEKNYRRTRISDQDWSSDDGTGRNRSNLQPVAENSTENTRFRIRASIRSPGKKINRGENQRETGENFEGKKASPGGRDGWVINRRGLNFRSRKNGFL
jgi:hypothetical protein